MDSSELTRLVGQAIREGVIDENAGIGFDDSAEVVIGRTRVQVLLGTYRRRLRVTQEGTNLRRQTEDLIHFLEGRDDEYLKTIRVSCLNDMERVFLADVDDNILFWMEMLDLPKYKYQITSEGEIHDPRREV